MENKRKNDISDLRNALAPAIATLTAFMLIVYAAMPVRVQAMPLVDGIPGVGPMVLPVPATPNRLPIEDVAPRELTVQEKLLRVCERRGYGVSCAKALLGMMWKESLNDGHAVGDHGNARGYFQIWYKLHNVPLSCAEDLECSADWTLRYMESNGYPRYVSYAVQCHNGCNAGNGYAASALRHGERMWTYDFAADTTLALK